LLERLKKLIVIKIGEVTRAFSPAKIVCLAGQEFFLKGKKKGGAFLIRIGRVRFS